MCHEHVGRDPVLTGDYMGDVEERCAVHRYEIDGIAHVVSLHEVVTCGKEADQHSEDFISVHLIALLSALEGHDPEQDSRCKIRDSHSQHAYRYLRLPEYGSHRRLIAQGKHYNKNRPYYKAFPSVVLLHGQTSGQKRKICNCEKQ